MFAWGQPEKPPVDAMGRGQSCRRSFLMQQHCVSQYAIQGRQAACTHCSLDSTLQQTSEQRLSFWQSQLAPACPLPDHSTLGSQAHCGQVSVTSAWRFLLKRLERPQLLAPTLISMLQAPIS